MKLIPLKDNFVEDSFINQDQYLELYKQSVENPEKFWAQQAERISWYKKWQKVKEVSFKSPVSIKWFLGAELNACYNCVDRHLPDRANKVALIWEADHPDTPSQKITYKQLHSEVSKFANVLKKHKVKKR